ncbi:unnamed protein product [Phytophthora fragariaefolia]|uniref:Unnamed protein product n=1 Tax=Phytophthora fragariaefolia TaxID=1490495 RepID=A0A9W6Y9S1_9STRA|nr:unnamed protein product [Phytophthora fragariaefolia]
MASFLLGDEYASSSSSSDKETSPRSHPDTKSPPPVAAAPRTQLLPSADELFASDTSSVLTASLSAAPAPAHKRKNEQASRPATKSVKTEMGGAVRKPKIGPFAPPQLRRPNISTEERRCVANLSS